MNGIRKVLYLTLAGLGLIVLVACSLLPGNLKDGVIAISVGIPRDSRALEVREYDVESLDIAIYGPDGLLLTEHLYHWTPPDSEVYWVKGIGEGTYRVVVTHNGVNGDETLSLTEEDTFEVAVMKVTSINIIPGLLTMVDVEGVEDLDITGYWTSAWTFESDFEFSPLYTYLRQSDTAISAAHGFSGELIDETMVLRGYLPWGELVDTSVYTDGEFTGDFVIVDDDGNVVFDENLGILQGTTRTVRTDPALFGDLTIAGDVGIYNEDLEEVEIVSIDFVSPYALAFDDGEGWLGFSYFDDDVGNDVNVDIVLEAGTWDVGDFTLTEDSAVSPRGYMSFSYGADGIEIGMHVSSDGMVHIDRIDDSSVAGTITVAGESDFTIVFDIPFAPPMPW